MKNQLKILEEKFYIKTHIGMRGISTSFEIVGPYITYKEFDTVHKLLEECMDTINAGLSLGMDVPPVLGPKEK